MIELKLKKENGELGKIFVVYGHGTAIEQEEDYMARGVRARFLA